MTRRARGSELVLGIDQGTTRTTAVVVDAADGRLVDQCSVELGIHYPRPGWVEQDAAEIVASVIEVATPLLERHSIAALGFDNQGETFVVWHADTGEPVAPAIVWQDQRGADVCRRLAGELDPRWLAQTTGLRLDSYFSAPKLAWLLEQDPELRALADAGRLRFGTTETWTLWKLSGGRLHVTDPSTASRTLLFDIRSLAWSDELLDRFAIPRSLLPEVVDSAGQVGSVALAAGRELPVCALLTDQQAALFGQACFERGDMKCTFGTGAFVLANTGNEPANAADGLLSTVAWSMPTGCTYALDGGIFVAGAAVQWLRDGLGLIADVADSAELAAGATDLDLVFVPALAGLAAPHWRTDVRGAIFGLSRGTTAADLARATLDGIAHRVREVVDAMAGAAALSPSVLKVDGGATANPVLMQSVADLVGVEVSVAADRESTAIGVANLAAHAQLGTPLDELAGRWRSEARYRPRLDPAERARRIERWRQCVDRVCAPGRR